MQRNAPIRTEERGHDAAQARQADGQRVDQRGQPVAAEDPHADERGLQEEGEQPLEGQGGAEDVAHEHRVIRPVHAELELLDDPAGVRFTKVTT